MKRDLAAKRAAAALANNRIWSEVGAISRLLIDEHQPDREAFPTALVLFAAHILVCTVNNGNVVGERRAEYFDAHRETLTAAYTEIAAVLDGSPSKLLPPELVKTLQRNRTMH